MVNQPGKELKEGTVKKGGSNSYPQSEKPKINPSGQQASSSAKK